MSIPKKTAVDLASITPISPFDGVTPGAMEAVNAVLEKMISGGVIDFYTLKHSGGIVSAN